MGKQSVRYTGLLATGSRRPLCTVALGVVLSVGRSRDSPRAIPVGPSPRARAATSLDPQLKRKHLVSAACVDSPRAIPTLRVGPLAAGSRRLPVDECARYDAACPEPVGAVLRAL